MMTTVQLAALLCVASVTQAKVLEREIVSTTVGKFRLTSEVGVSPLGKKSYLFKVKSCGSAIIALSNIVGISNSAGRYFMIYIGRKHNKQTDLLDSCFSCAPKAHKEKPVLNCTSFNHFWVGWEEHKSVRLGEGATVGENVLVEYSTDRPFPVMFLLVTTLSVPTTWRFIQPDETIFTAPRRDGSSKATVKEDAAIGMVVYPLVITPMADIVLVTNTSHFQLKGSELITSSQLDFEKERIFLLLFRAVELDVNLTLTVLVEDVNDETPDVVLGEGVHIPEELPVGFIIGGVFTATDRDASDNLTYSLEGEDSKYLSVLDTGLMRVERRIDRDGPNGRTKLDKLTLHVEDAAHHKSTSSLTIIVTDINDNVPTCASGFFSKTINRTTSSDVSVVNVPCTDDDDESNGQFSLRIKSQNKDHRKLFRLKAFDLFADVDTLRRESTRKESSVYILTILAVDTPKQGQANTGTAVVVINFIQLNEYEPQWKAPVPDINHNFPSVTVPESTSPGTVVTTFSADDKDPETVVKYTLASVTDDNGNNVTGHFTVNTNTGELTSTAKFDCDPQTGGSEYYTLLVMATDGKHNISGNVKIIVKNANDNVPAFNKSVQMINVKTVKSVAVPLLELDVHDRDKSSAVTLHLEKADRQFFQLVKESEKWQLKFRPGIDPQKNPDIPPVIRVTANDNGDPPLTSEATVVLTDLPCHVPTPSPTSAVPPFRRRRCSWSSTLPMTSTTQMNVDKTDSSISSLESPVCQPSSTSSQQDSRTGLYLKIACAAEGLIIVMATLFIIAKKCGCLKKSSPADQRRERKEPVGCETALYGSAKEKSKEVPTSQTAPNSQLEVVSEVSHVQHSATDEGSAGAMLPLGLSLKTAQKTFDAKNRFLGLRRNEAVPPVQIYSDPSGVTLFDKDIVSIAIPKFVDMLKAPPVVADGDTGEMVYVRKNELLAFLKLSLLEAPEDLLNHLDSQNSDCLAFAKEKFRRLISNHTQFDLSEEAPPLDVTSLLDGSCFNCSDEAMVAVDKNKFLDMLKESETQNTFLTSNDAILANASGFDPGTNIVYVAKEKFFNMVRNREQEDESHEMLVLSRDNVMELVQSKIDPWAEQKSAVMQFVSGIDGESGETFMTKKAFLDLVNGNKDNDNATDDMVAVTKPKLAELLQKNSENPKCNETLNYYVKAVSPASGIVYMAKRKFLDLSKPENGPGCSDDILEVEKDHMGALMASNGADPASVDTALKVHSLGFMLGTKRIYVAKSRFLALTSASGKQSNIDVEENEILEVSKDTIDDMSESAGNPSVPVIAVNEEKGSVFIDKKSFLELSSYDYEGSDMIVLTKEKAAEIADPDEDKDTFLQRHALAFTPATGKVYVARSKFINMMKEKQLKSQTGDPEGDELVSVPREQLTEMLTTTGTQKASSFIRAHAAAFNPATGAVFMARKKFLDVASKQNAFVSGKNDDELIAVTKEKLTKIVHDTGDSQRDLSKFALAFSGDTNTAFIAKSKFLKLCKPAESSTEGGVCEDVLKPIPEETLPHKDNVAEENKYRNVGNSTMTRAKNMFMSKACIKISATTDDEETDARADTDSGPESEALSDSSNIYHAKNQFLECIKDKNAGPSMVTEIAEKDLEGESLDHLDDNVHAADCVQSSRGTVCPSTHLVTNTDTVVRKTFANIARKSLNLSGCSSNDNDIVAVNESQVAEILNQEGEKGNMSQLLQKHALAVNKTDGKVYFLKKKFQELSLNARKENSESLISTTHGHSVPNPDCPGPLPDASTAPNDVSDLKLRVNAERKTTKSYWNHPLMYGSTLDDKQEDIRRIPCGYEDDTGSDDSDDSYTESSVDSQLDTDTEWPQYSMTDQRNDKYEAVQVPPNTSKNGGGAGNEGTCQMKAKESGVRHRHHGKNKKRKSKGCAGHSKAERKKKHKRKSKIAPEMNKSASEMSDLDEAEGGKRTKKKCRKSGQIHPEIDTSETEDRKGSVHRQKIQHKKHKRSKHK